MTSTSEQDVAGRVVAWLRSQAWTVYQEVSTGYGNPVADIVAVSGSLSWIIECKRSKTLALVDQARAWWGWSTFISVATPATRDRATYRLRGWSTWHYLLGHFGIGELDVGSDVRQRLAPAICRKRLASARIESYLRDEQRSGDYAPAGAHGGGHWTPFRNTCRALAEWVKKNEGGKLTDAVSAIDHHYGSGRSARGSLGKWISCGKLPGVTCRDGRLYSEATA